MQLVAGGKDHIRPVALDAKVFLGKIQIDVLLQHSGQHYVYLVLLPGVVVGMHFWGN